MKITHKLVKKINISQFHEQKHNTPIWPFVYQLIPLSISSLTYVTEAGSEVLRVGRGGAAGGGQETQHSTPQAGLLLGLPGAHTKSCLHLTPLPMPGQHFLKPMLQDTPFLG